MVVTDDVLTIGTLILSVINASIYSYLLLSVFVWKTYKKNSDWTLFYARYLIDVLYTTARKYYPSFPKKKTVRTLVAVCTVYMQFVQQFFPDFFYEYKSVWFYVSWPFYNLGSTRELLVFLIGFDRTCASYFPIYYHNNRKNLPNMWILSIVFAFSLAQFYVLFGYCGFTFDSFPEDCGHFGCGVGVCFVLVWVNYGQTIYLLIVFCSLLLAIRLYLWNGLCRKSKKPEVVTKATRLALLDSIIVIIFGVIPSAIVTKVPSLIMNNVGPILGFLKILGFVVESTILLNVFRNRNKMSPASGSTVIVRKSTIITNKFT
uniref:Uncharacterized protein n=1 Tax=Caenorhabditis japonica TaxID=281687 RepID=A0A8R1DLL6_CAEJA